MCQFANVPIAIRNIAQQIVKLANWHIIQKTCINSNPTTMETTVATSPGIINE